MKHERNWEGSSALSGTDPLVRAAVAEARRKGYIRDQFMTFDQATIDSAGAFLIGELERLDPMIHLPLVSTTWTRDIDLRTDVQMGDEQTSYTLSTFGQAGGVAPAGINWASKDQTAIPRTTVDIGKIVNPLNLVSYEIAYTIPELQSSQLTGRPIDTQMLAGMNLKHQMDLDQMVYIGDTSVNSAYTGLVNSASVTNVANVANGAGGTPEFTTKTPDEILTDFNELLLSVWAASGYTTPPTKILMAPTPFGYISTTPITVGGTGVAETILSWLKKKNILTAEKDIELDIKSVKWLDKTVRGVAADRMVAYTQRQDYVRYPMVPLQSIQPQPRGIWIAVPYYGRLGIVEVVYPETMGYRDGI